MLNNKSILITGGTGSLGKALTKHILKKYPAIKKLIIFSRDEQKQFLMAQEFPESKFESIRYFIGDIRDFDRLKRALRGVDYVIHTAAMKHVPLAEYNPMECVKTNILGTINVLDYAAKMNSRVLQASTSEIYGDPEIHPQIENYWGNVNPIGIRSCYDEGKRCAETLCFDFIRQHKLDIKVIRIFNTYGPRMHPDDGRVVSNFIVQALKGEPITVYGDGNQTRSFCYIDDLVDAIILMMKSNITGPINLGNPNEFKIIELAETVVQITNSTSEIKYDKLPQDDPKQRCPDISFARDKLGWKPKILLEEGLKKTINYFDSIL